MKAVLNFFLGLTVGLVAFVNAAPTSNEDRSLAVRVDPSTEYHYYSAVQIWVGTNRALVGDLIGSALYGTTWSLLGKGCPPELDSTRTAGVGTTKSSASRRIFSTNGLVVR